MRAPILLLTVFCITPLLHAQASTDDPYQDVVRLHAARTRSVPLATEDLQSRAAALLKPANIFLFVKHRAEWTREQAQKGVAASQESVEASRNDEHTGATAGAGAVASIAALAGVPQFLSAALESGGLSQTGPPTAATLRLKPLILYDLIQKRPVSPCQQYLMIVDATCGRGVDGVFGGLSASISLNANPPSNIPAQAVAATNTSGTSTPTGGGVLNIVTHTTAINSWSVRYELYNRRDVKNKRFMAAWKSTVKDIDPKVVESYGPQVAKLDDNFDDNNNPEKAKYDKWRADAIEALVRDSGDLDKLKATWDASVDAFIKFEPAQKILQDTTALEKLESQRKNLIKSANDALRPLLTAPILSVEYTELRPLNQPTLSNLKLLLSRPFSVPDTVAAGAGGTITRASSKQEGMLSFNFGADLYNTIPQGAKVGRLRDVQAALQLDMPLARKIASSDAIFSLAAYYQYQIENGLLNIGAGTLAPNTSITLPADAKTLLTPKGGTFIGQAKLTLKLAGSQIKVPISVSWANRSDLIKESEVRGQIGFTFDWDSLLQGKH